MYTLCSKFAPKKSGPNVGEGKRLQLKKSRQLPKLKGINFNSDLVSGSSRELKFWWRRP